MSNDPRQEPEPDPIGRRRTMWHPILRDLLEHLLRNSYRVEYEAHVGRAPLRIDYFLVRRGDVAVPVEARTALAGMIERFNERTLIELKGPTDVLENGDFRTLLAYLHLWIAQNDVGIDPERLSAMVVAPRLTGPYSEELRRCGVQVTEAEPGVHRLTGGMLGGHAGWVVETARFEDAAHLVLTLIGPTFRARRVAVYNQFRQAGCGYLVNYVCQRVRQFELLGERFAMLHDDFEQEARALWRDLMGQLTADDLALVPAEERVRGLSPDDRVRGLSPDDLLASMTPEQREAIARALNRQPPARE